MALSLTISATAVTLSGTAQDISDLGDMFTTLYNYQTTVPDGTGQMVTNPETKAQFTKRILAQFYKDQWKAYKLNAAIAQAKIDNAAASTLSIS